MNKFLTSIIILAAVAAAFVTTGSVFAQGPNPQAPAPATGLNQAAAPGRGMGNGYANAPRQGANLDQDGYLHQDLIPYYAEKLGLSVDELNTRLANGETLSQIAYASGLSFDDLRTLMADARTAALQQSVTDGTLTQAQADWMAQRGAGASAYGQGRGMRGANAGAGLGQYANPDCPYLVPAE